MAYSSEIQSIIIMVEHSSMQADMVLEKEPRVLHLDMQATGSELRLELNYATGLNKYRPQNPPPQ